MGDNVPALTRLLEKSGTAGQPDTIRGWEAGASPSAAAIRAMEGIFGQDAPEAPSEAAELAAILSELVGEVRLSRVAQETSAKALGELAGMVAALLAREGTRVGQELPDGAGTPAGP